ncbi:hypothetical protein [Clostridium estertheticum]|uniref:hypothetical protein n=1 Tax=Clostridium estertheticum TaxID=238834 RepID=UPI001C0E3366|nr:hypothetical protein [Clostridium estertheticum]MBU3171050.1 hypothetical protein [Clostridium estertheticum]
MLRLTLLEVVLRSLPEEFLVIFAVYVFSKTVVNVKRYIISSIIYIIAVCLIRLLPIQYGVHTILNIIIIIVLTTNVNKISIINSIKASIITVILLFICEGINVFIVRYVFKVDVKHVFSQPLSKILYSVPSLVIFALIVFTYYFYLVKKNKLSEVMNGEII